MYPMIRKIHCTRSDSDYIINNQELPSKEYARPGITQPELVWPERQRRFYLQGMDEKAGHPLARAGWQADNRYLQYLVGTHTLQFAFQGPGRMGEERCAGGRRLSR